MTGHFDAGKPLYIVTDAAGKHLSYHETAEGAEAQLKARQPEATGIQKAELHH